MEKIPLRYEMIIEYEATTQTAEEVSKKYNYSGTRFHEFGRRFIKIIRQTLLRLKFNKFFNRQH